MELLIKNARVIDASQDYVGDVYINNGIIHEIGKDIKKDKYINTIDANGLILMPSFIDLHSHFREPGYTHKEDIISGSMAAVKGGYTVVNLMANTNPVCSSMKIVKQVTEKAEQVGLVEVNQVVSITEDLKGQSIDHLIELDSNVKFISDDGKGVGDSKVMLDAMIKAKKKNITVISHAESPEMITVDTRLAENMMTWRDLTLSKFTECALHLAHVSTKEAMKDIIEAKKEGGRVTCEVTPHHIAMTKDINDYRVNPPLREKEDVDFLIKSIKDGWVDVIATDHAPHTEEDKHNGAPGISGIETSFSICFTKLVKDGHITLNKLSELMSKRPGEIMDLNKGEIKIGYDADLVLIDINNKYRIDADKFLSKGKNTPFNNTEVYGKVITTIRKGKIVFNA